MAYDKYAGNKDLVSKVESDLLSCTKVLQSHRLGGRPLTQSVSTTTYTLYIVSYCFTVYMHFYNFAMLFIYSAFIAACFNKIQFSSVQFTPSSWPSKNKNNKKSTIKVKKCISGGTTNLGAQQTLGSCLLYTHLYPC